MTLPKGPRPQGPPALGGGQFLYSHPWIQEARRTFVRCSFPPEPLVQMMRCLEKRKHCRSPSFLRDSEPRRPRVILPFSDMGTWMREPAGEAC